MSRYIDADMIEYFKTFNPNKGEKTIADMAWRSDIDAIPTADVAPVVHGKWVLNDDQVYECKECGYVPSFDGYTYFNYCPNCGAKMDERREDGKIQ